MLLNDNLADLSLEALGGSAEVEDEFTLVELNLFAVVVGHDTSKLQQVLTLLEAEVATVAEGVGVVLHIGVFVYLDGDTTQVICPFSIFRGTPVMLH